jgi:Zn-dependent peptidase ImmA (M78 family)
MNAALSLRESWMLGAGPVGQLVDYLDFVGLPVIPISGVFDFDAAACFAQDAGAAPLLLLSIDISGDEQRFALARELAYLLAPDVSVQGAGSFARTFLAHPVLLRADLGKARRDLDPLELYTLKHRYGLSITHLLAHAQMLGIFSVETYQDWGREMGEQDWAVGEPGFDVPVEIPAVMLRRVRRLLAEEQIDEEQALELSVLPWLDMDLLTGYPLDLVPEEEAG